MIFSFSHFQHCSNSHRYNEILFHRNFKKETWQDVLHWRFWKHGKYWFSQFCCSPIWKQGSGFSDRRIKLFHGNLLCVFMTVLVCWVCCDKNTIHWWLQLYFPQFWKPGSLRSRRRRFSIWWGPASWFICGLLDVSSHVRRHERALWGLFYQGLISFMRTPPSWPNHLPRAPPPIPSHWGLGFSIRILGDHKC